MKRFGWMAAAAVAAAALAAPGVAGAKTLVVDDDNDCADRQFTSIQAAVDAAQPGDTVAVCRGIYTEAVTVSTDKVKLISRTLWGAQVIAPLDGSSPFRITSRSVLLRGFSLGGNRPRTNCGDAIEVNGLATIDRNLINDFACDDPTEQGGRGIVVDPLLDTDPLGTVTISNNQLTNTGWTGIDIRGTYGLVRVQHNQLIMTPTDAFAPSGIRCLRFCTTVRIQSNSVEGSPGPGIWVNGFENAGLNALVSANTVRANGTGIKVEFVGAGIPDGDPIVKVQKNRAFDNVGNGLEHDGGGGYFKNNRSLGNGGFDCFEQFPNAFGTWTGNIGVTDSPSHLCRPPD